MTVWAVEIEAGDASRIPRFDRMERQTGRMLAELGTIYSLLGPKIIRARLNDFRVKYNKACNNKAIISHGFVDHFP